MGNALFDWRIMSRIGSVLLKRAIEKAASLVLVKTDRNVQIRAFAYGNEPLKLHAVTCAEYRLQCLKESAEGLHEGPERQAAGAMAPGKEQFPGSSSGCVASQ